MRKAIYPGSFDPVHNGHLDVIERASRLCDCVVVAVANNDQKNALFSVQERVEIVKEATGAMENVEVTSFDGLLVNFASSHGIQAVVRGLRAVSDFEYEFQMALMNRQLHSEIETLFLIPSQENIYLSSRMIKEIARLGGKFEDFVPEATARALARYATRA